MSMEYAIELDKKWHWLVRETRVGWRITLRHGRYVFPIHGVTFISKEKAKQAIRNGRIVFADHKKTKEKNQFV